MQRCPVKLLLAAEEVVHGALVEELEVVWEVLVHANDEQARNDREEGHYIPPLSSGVTQSGKIGTTH